MHSNLKPVFLVGTPKSGTTFLYALFNGHPDVVSLLETNAYLNKGGKKKDIRDKLLLNAEHSNNEPTHFIEKTPSHYAHVDNIIDDFPEALFIHLIRDPRDNYLSLKRRMDDITSAQYQSYSYHPLAFFNNRIIRSLEYAYMNSIKYPTTYRVIHYEDIITEGKSVILDILKFIDLKWDDCLLTPSLGDKTWKGWSTDLELRGQLKSFDKRPIGRWIGRLTKREIIICEAVIHRYSLGNNYIKHSYFSRVFIIISLFFPYQDEFKLQWKYYSKNGISPFNFFKLIYIYCVLRLKIASNLVKSAKNIDELNRINKKGV